MRHATYRQQAIRLLTASSLFTAASFAATRDARAFELARNPDIPSCTNFFNRGQAVALPSGDGVATDGNCNPAAPNTHYRAWALNDRVIRISGVKTCDFVLQPDGIHLTRQKCWPNPRP